MASKWTKMTSKRSLWWPQWSPFNDLSTVRYFEWPKQSFFELFVTPRRRRTATTIRRHWAAPALQVIICVNTVLTGFNSNEPGDNSAVRITGPTPNDEVLPSFILESALLQVKAVMPLKLLLLPLKRAREAGKRLDMKRTVMETSAVREKN